MVRSARRAWTNVTRAQRCPICGHDSWCSLSHDGVVVVCRRQPGARGEVDPNGAPYWVHRLEGAAPVRAPARVSLPMGAPLADRTTLHSIYASLLLELRLSDEHRESLRRRGLSDAEIDRREYRTLPVRGRAELARRLVERYAPENCARVPGLYVHEENGRRWWSLAGAGGLVIPVRDAVGKIAALRLRSHGAGGSRYSWMSSRAHGGPGPGSVPHVPLSHGGDRRIIRLTEGELKADVATVLSGTLTLSLPGVAQIQTVLPLLQEIRPETVWVAFDADWRTNPHVRRALRAAVLALEKL